MKKLISDFFRRGFIACGFGPMVLVIFYLILYYSCDLQILTVREVCLGILSLSALAFIAGGMNVIYQVERLPLMAAILIHGGVLYVSYLVTYLINRWLERGITPILVFSVIFILGYLAIWGVIYGITKRNTAQINAMLQQNQQTSQTK